MFQFIVLTFTPYQSRALGGTVGLAQCGAVLNAKVNENITALVRSEEKAKKVAVIGPNAKERVISGGGSAALKASYIVSPFEGITANAPGNIEFEYEVGCYGESLGRPLLSILV